ncbi:MAG: F0F1 ATP synthase subunit delta [Bacteriovoracaceae bacterium]|nr:F0F1 ATP synthase subunit delta [Bacteriovoracaceae bacterium]
MKLESTAKAYASALMELGREQGVDVASELTKFSEMINSSNDLENVLFLGVFNSEEKLNVFLSLAEKINLSSLLKNFTSFLIAEDRMNLFPLIFQSAVIMEDAKRGFITSIVEGQEDQMGPESLSSIKNYIKNKLGLEPKIVYKKNSQVTVGYKVTVNDMQIDATLDNQLEQFKKSVLENN